MCWIGDVCGTSNSLSLTVYPRLIAYDSIVSSRVTQNEWRILKRKKNVFRSMVYNCCLDNTLDDIMNPISHFEFWKHIHNEQLDPPVDLYRRYTVPCIVKRTKPRESFMAFKWKSFCVSSGNNAVVKITCCAKIIVQKWQSCYAWRWKMHNLW